MRIRDIATIASCTLPEQDTVWLLNLDAVEQQTGKVIEYKYISPDSLTGSTTAFDTNTVLYSKLRPNLNKVVVPTMSGYATSEMLPLRPDPQICTREYLACYLRSNAFVEWAVSKTNGAKMPRLGTKDLLDKEIPVPSIQTQEYIVAIFACVESLIDDLSQMLSHFDDLVKSRFIEMFGDITNNDRGWETQPLGDLCTIVRGGSPRPIEKFLGGDVPWIKIGDATDGESVYLHSTKEHIIQEGVAKSRKVKAGSLIFANCGVSLGFARIITFDGCIHDGWLAMEDIDSRLDKVFLLQALNQMTEHFRKIAPAGTQPNLNTAIMKAYRQIIPPMEQQTSFIRFVEQTDKSKVEIQNALNELEILKKSLMQQYFG